MPLDLIGFSGMGKHLDTPEGIPDDQSQNFYIDEAQIKLERFEHNVEVGG